MKNPMDKLDVFIIAVDFDGVITLTSEFPNIGHINDNAIITLLRLQSLGIKLILWTARAGNYLGYAKGAIHRHGIKFDTVNDNVIDIKNIFNKRSPKVFAHVYLDDNAYGWDGDWDAIYVHCVNKYKLFLKSKKK